MRRAIPFLIITVVAAALGFNYSYHLPNLKAWLLGKLASQSAKHLPVKIYAQDLSPHLFPLGLSLKSVVIEPNDEKTQMIEGFRIDEVQINLHFWQLLSGRLRVREVLVIKPLLALRLDLFNKKSAPIKISEIINFDQALGVPIDRITVLRSDFDINLSKYKLLIRSRQFSASLSRGRGSLALQVLAPRTAIQSERDASDVSFSSRGGLRLTENQFQVADFHVKKGKSIVRLNGEISGDISKFDFDRFDRPVAMKVQALLELEELTSWLQKSFPQLHLPLVRGQFRGDLLASHAGRAGQNLEGVEITGSIKATELKVDKFFVGTVLADGRFRNRTLNLTKAQVDTKAGQLDLSGELTLRDKYPFTAKATAHKFNLHDFLLNLSVPDIPVELAFDASLPCMGNLLPQPILRCSGNVEGRGLQVWNSRAREKTVVRTETLYASGEVTASAQDVQYHAQLKSNNGSIGQSSGLISYEKGFQIAYGASHLDMRDITNLADLKLEGTARLEGSTQGNSDTATFSMDVVSDSLWFENFFLGRAQTNLAYKSGLLSFRNVVGQIGSSQYKANVNFFTSNNLLEVSATSPYFEVGDLLGVFQRKFTLPVSAKGSGSAQIQVSGPPRFTALSYGLRSSLFRGSVAGEPFDKAVFNVTSREGHVTIDEAYINKSRGNVNMSGSGHPDGNINVKIAGRGIRLEDLSNVSSASEGVSGDLNFDMSLLGYVLLPEAKLKARLSKMALGDAPIGPSSVQLQFHKNYLQGSGTLWGGDIETNVVYPYNLTQPFELDLLLRRLDLIPFVASLTASPLRNEYNSEISGEIKLRAESGGIWNSSGFARVDSASLRRGILALNLQKPALIQIKQGQLELGQLNLESVGSYIRFTGNRPAKKKIDLTCTARLDAAAFQILTPFLSELRGLVTVNGQLRADQNNFELLGTAFLDQGVLKFKQFPHTFQNLKSDVLFSQHKLIFNSITGNVAQGQLSADGEVELRGYKDVPVQLRASLTQIDLNVPDGFQSKGDADLQIMGQWFPYLLRGTYNIHSGTVTAEFNQTKSATTGLIQPSIYLPPVVFNEVFSPLRLDLNLDIGGSFQVRNSLADTPISGRLQVTGTPAAPQIKGVLVPRQGGKVLAHETEFEIQGGTITFIESKTYDPTIYLAASSRVQNFDINLLVQGTAKKPQIKLSSSPPMSEQEIIQLLALGVVPASYQSDPTRNESREAAQGGARIGSALLGDSPLKKEFTQKTGLKLDISSANPNKTPTFAPSGDTVSEPKITVSRQWTPKFGASASRTVGDVQSSDVKFKYQLNRSMSVVGRWETRENTSTTAPQSAQTSQNTSGLDSSSLFGLDLEYKLEFK